MPYIARDDGEHFVIPSYRDVLSVKNKGQFKQDIHQLSQSYGEYITMQKKNAMQYEIAFSPDTGYLLGETVWQYFKKPEDMIYCEAIPGSAEVILVIVKDSSVYLDGSFPVENVSEELVVFLTQQAHFEIYTFGDVPIADSPEDGKFSFDVKSVKSFTRLDNAVFADLPLISTCKFQLVDAALKAHGIDALPPIIPIIAVIIFAGLGWYLFGGLGKSESEPELEQMQLAEKPVDPYAGYKSLMIAPLPDKEIIKFEKQLEKLMMIPGWVVKDINYKNGQFSAKVLSSGGTIDLLYQWAKRNDIKVKMENDGYALSSQINLEKVDRSSTIVPIEEVMRVMIDRMATVYRGNNLKIGSQDNQTVYNKIGIQLQINGFAPMYMDLIAKQFENLPLVVQEIKGDIGNGKFTGTISLIAAGK